MPTIPTNHSVDDQQRFGIISKYIPRIFDQVERIHRQPTVPNNWLTSSDFLNKIRDRLPNGEDD